MEKVLAVMSGLFFCSEIHTMTGSHRMNFKFFFTDLDAVPAEGRSPFSPG
jgi:hypothetical protein